MEEETSNKAQLQAKKSNQIQLAQEPPSNAAEANKEDKEPDSNDMNTDEEAECYTRIFDMCMTHYTPQLDIAYTIHIRLAFLPY